MQFRTRVLSSLLIAVLATGAVLLWLSHRNASQLVFRVIQEKVLAVAASVAPQIDGDLHATLKEGEDENNAAYRNLQAVMRKVRDANQTGDLRVVFIYTLRPTVDGQAWEYVVDAEEEGEDKSALGDLVEFREGEEFVPELGRANVDSAFTKDSYGTWLTAFAPVRNAAGKDVALVGVDIEAAAVSAQMASLLAGGLLALLIACIGAAIASWYLARRVSAPLEALEQRVTRIGEGDLTVRVPVMGGDEFGKLGLAVNQMAAGLQEREAFKGALVRFVSGQSVTDKYAAGSPVGSGLADGSPAASDRRVTVLSVALRGFGVASSQMQADRVSTFLSDWYSTMIDLVIQHRGSLEKSTGQTIAATFGAPLSDAAQERHAIEAALTMQQAFAALRTRWRTELKTEVAIRIVIHSGQVAVSKGEDGPVMDVSLLGQLVDIGAAIQGAVELENAAIIISKDTADGLRGTLPLGDLPAIEIGQGDNRQPISLHSVDMPMLNEVP